MSENKQNNDGYFSGGMEPIEEAKGAEFDIDALKAVIKQLEIQLGELVYQRDDFDTESGDTEKLEEINVEIRTVEMNIGANRLKLQQLVDMAAPKLAAANDRITEISGEDKAN